MGHLRRLILPVGLVLLAGCAKKRSLEVRPRPISTVDAGVPESELYTADGKLKPGPERVDWLELPRAFERTKLDYERHRLFVANGVTLERARDFLAERMLSGKLEERPNSVFYPGVMPVGGGTDAVRLNVRLTQRLTGQIELDIERLTSDGVKPLPFEEAKRAAAAEAKHGH
jgi:hypothetical protein